MDCVRGSSGSHCRGHTAESSLCFVSSVDSQQVGNWKKPEFFLMLPLRLGGTEDEKREHSQAIHTLDFIKLHSTAGQWGRDHCTHFADKKTEAQRG